MNDEEIYQEQQAEEEFYRNQSGQQQAQDEAEMQYEMELFHAKEFLEKNGYIVIKK